MQILLVGGNYNQDGGKASGLVNKMFCCLQEIIKENNMLVNMYNGGTVADLERILEETKFADVVIWMPNVPNDVPKIRNVKEVNPYTMLITSKRNDGGKYTFQEIINRSLGLKANMTIEFRKTDSGIFNMMAFDPLGTCWYDGVDLPSCMKKVMERIVFLKSITRQKTISTDEDKNLLMKWYFDQYKQEEYSSSSRPEIPEKDSFIQLVKQYAEIFHKIMVPEQGVNRFLGNASLRPKEKTNFRCTKGFPSFKAGKYIFVSERNVNKEFLNIDNFVPTYLEDGKVYYCGEKKPSVDTPIQLRLYDQLPNINYMIHSHCYLENAAFTKTPIPCGAIEEVEEILSLIDGVYESREKNQYRLNLIGHGSIIMGSDVVDLEDARYVARKMPEMVRSELAMTKEEIIENSCRLINEYEANWEKKQEELQSTSLNEEMCELKAFLEKDDTLEEVDPTDLKCLGHSPEHGYFAWMFKYKHTYVVLYDESNGHYSFGGQIDDITKIFLPDIADRLELIY